jgi:hypothetical protein
LFRKTPSSALRALLNLPAPEPATGQRERDSYVFERRDSLRQALEQFAPMVGELWRAMDGGQFSVAIRAALPHFKGKLFKQPEALPLERAQIELLREAARADWREVEPANFGTLLERALSPTERSRLGAHYTPRASWSGWVLPTVIEPLRADWDDARNRMPRRRVGPRWRNGGFGREQPTADPLGRADGSASSGYRRIRARRNRPRSGGAVR